MMHLLPRATARLPLLQIVAITLVLSTFLNDGVVPPPVLAAGSAVVYGDGLASGWENWSWDASVNFGATRPVHGGSRSIAFTYNKAWAGLYFHTRGVNTSGYTAIQFYLNGGNASGQLTDVALYDASLKQIPSPKPVNKYIQGGSIAAGQWRLVRIPLADLGGANRVISGILIQDLAGHAQPTIYLDDLQLVGSSAPSGGRTTSPPPPTATPVRAPAPPQIGGSQPFTDVPNHPTEYAEAKGALQWMPQIKRAVGEAVAAGLLRPDERQMFENILLGMVGLESAGKVFVVGNSSSQWYSQGLTQLTFANTYKEEDPFDPLTNLRNALRVVIRYYRKWGNRWDRAVAQHLTGAEDENAQRYTRDWNGTDGEDYAKRIINIVWTANQLKAKGDLYADRDSAYQGRCSAVCWYDHAAWWSIWDSPNLPYNWMPPNNNTAYWYVQSGVDGNIKQPIATNTWIPVPGWFYTTSPAPGVGAFNPRAPTSAEAQSYPAGRTPNVPWGDTYPRRMWSVGNP